MRRNEPHCTRDYPTGELKDYPDPPKEEPEDQPQHISSVLEKVLIQFGIDVNQPEQPLTVDQAAIKRYGVYDVTLPQPWVDKQMKAGFDPRAHFVWCYDKCSVFGEPAPITEEGDAYLKELEDYAATSFSERNRAANINQMKGE